MIHIWIPETDDSQIYRGDSQINSLAWSPNGKMLTAASSSGSVWNWNIATGERQLVFQYDSAATSVAWNEESKLLALGLSQGTVAIWDMTEELEVMRVDRHVGFVWDLSWNADLFASAGTDGLVQLWDLATQENIATLTGHIGTVRTVDWYPDGQ